MKRTINLLLLIFLFFSVFVYPQNVIIAVMDGARYTETFGDSTHANIPHLFDMKQYGTLYTNFRIESPGITETCPGHSAIVTGTWQPIANDGSERPDKPTIFEYFREEANIPIQDCYVVAGKSKLNVLSYSTDTAYGSSYGASVWAQNSNDDNVYNQVISIMNNDHPRLMIINFPSVDLTGHSGNWDNYLAAISNADGLIYNLWQNILAGTSDYDTTNTTLFILNDHGRHDDAHGGFQNHGDYCEGCTHIMLLALGRGVTQGQEISNTVYQIDIAPTVGDLLSFSTPYADGTSLYEYTPSLPVELSYFSADIVGNKVRLNWQTKSETNNRGFEVERQVGSWQSAVGNWENRGFVEGNGTTIESHSYSFIDNNISSGTYNYRLKQIDFDGNYKYSKVVEVLISNPKGFLLEQNYPNPFNPTTKISWQSPVGSWQTLKVYDVLGREIAVLVNEYKPAGKYEVEFSTEGGSNYGGKASSLPSGIYFYKLKAGNYTQVKKMILIR